VACAFAADGFSDVAPKLNIANPTTEQSRKTANPRGLKTPDSEVRFFFMLS
jgi:hypothetical protein